mmetsp:Transcript_25836/g.46943  ORF Transcript_25836/g.46943 Transcript_25836/m.46943 type:complete len:288 (+) Transcript_25836:84-947(+)
MHFFLAIGWVTLLASQSVSGEVKAIAAGLAWSDTIKLKAGIDFLLNSESVGLEDILGTEEMSDWIRFLHNRSDRKLLRRLVEGYSSVISVPGGLVYKELLQEFPKAKVILTKHPGGSEAWYKSTMESMWRLNDEIFNSTWIGQIPKIKLIHDQLREMYLDSHFMSREQWLQKDVAIARYEAWNAEVESVVPPPNFLVWSADMGWYPLCHLLGLTVPHHKFPSPGLMTSGRCDVYTKILAGTTGKNIKKLVTMLHAVRIIVPVVLLIVGLLICLGCARTVTKVAGKQD